MRKTQGDKLNKLITDPRDATIRIISIGTTGLPGVTTTGRTTTDTTTTGEEVIREAALREEMEEGIVATIMVQIMVAGRRLIMDATDEKTIIQNHGIRQQ